jgi:hypothetical protein
MTIKKPNNFPYICTWKNGCDAWALSFLRIRSCHRAQPTCNLCEFGPLWWLGWTSIAPSAISTQDHKIQESEAVVCCSQSLLWQENITKYWFCLNKIERKKHKQGQRWKFGSEHITYNGSIVQISIWFLSSEELLHHNAKREYINMKSEHM